MPQLEVVFWLEQGEEVYEEHFAETSVPLDMRLGPLKAGDMSFGVANKSGKAGRLSAERPPLRLLRRWKYAAKTAVEDNSAWTPGPTSVVEEQVRRILVQWKGGETDFWT